MISSTNRVKILYNFIYPITVLSKRRCGGNVFKNFLGWVLNKELGAKPGNISNFHESPKIETINYERTDLVYYSTNSSEDAKPDTRYWRRKEKKIILTENDLTEPYTRLGTFTVAGPKPPDLKKVKEHLLQFRQFWGHNT